MLSFRVLVAGLPFLTVALALAYRLGAAEGVVRTSSFVKELVIVGLVTVAGSRVARDRRRPDLLDGRVVGFVVLAPAYLVAPGLVVTGPGETASFYDRLLGWRSEVLYLVLFLALRHLRPRTAEVTAAVRAFGAAAVVVAAVGIAEFFLASAWRDVLVEDLQVHRYLADVQNLSAPRVQHLLGQLANRAAADAPRIGSVLFVPTTLAATLLIAFGFGVERAFRAPLPRAGALALGVVLTAIVMTQTRAVIGAGVLIVVVAAWAQGRSRGRPVRRVLEAGAAVVLVTVLLGALTGALDRFGDADRSDRVHADRLTDAADVLADAPMGRGLGTGYAAEWGSGLRTVTENQYLNIGVQIGVAGAVLLIAILVVLVWRLGAVAASGRAETRVLCAGARAAILGLALVGVLSQPFAELVPAWCAWGLAGAALGAAERREATG